MKRFWQDQSRQLAWNGKGSVGGQARTFVCLLEADTRVPRDCLPAVMDDKVGWRKRAIWEGGGGGSSWGRPSSSSSNYGLLGVKVNQDKNLGTHGINSVDKDCDANSNLLSCIPVVFAGSPALWNCYSYESIQCKVCSNFLKKSVHKQQNVNQVKRFQTHFKPKSLVLTHYKSYKMQQHCSYMPDLASDFSPHVNYQSGRRRPLVIIKCNEMSVRHKRRTCPKWAPVFIQIEREIYCLLFDWEFFSRASCPLCNAARGSVGKIRAYDTGRQHCTYLWPFKLLKGHARLKWSGRQEREGTLSTHLVTGCRSAPGHKLFRLSDLHVRTISESILKLWHSSRAHTHARTHTHTHTHTHVQWRWASSLSLSLSLSLIVCLTSATHTRTSCLCTLVLNKKNRYVDNTIKRKNAM